MQYKIRLQATVIGDDDDEEEEEVAAAERPRREREQELMCNSRILSKGMCKICYCSFSPTSSIQFSSCTTRSLGEEKYAY